MALSSANGLTYYQYSLFISSGAVVISFAIMTCLYIIRQAMQYLLEEKHSDVVDNSATLYDIYTAKSTFKSWCVVFVINVLYWLENFWVMMFVWSVLSYFGASTAFEFVHWGISFSVSVLITIIVSLHTFRHRNLHKQLRKKDFIEHEVHNALLLTRNQTAADLMKEVRMDDIELDEVDYFPLDKLKVPNHEIQSNPVLADLSTPPATPDVDSSQPLNNNGRIKFQEEHVPNTPLGKLKAVQNEEFVYREFTKEELGVIKFVLFEFFTEFEIYFRSIEMGIKKYRFFLFLIYLLFNVLVTTFIVSFFYGTCVCKEPYRFSTAFTRYVNSDVCGTEKLCGLVLNLPEDPSTEMVVKFYSQSASVKSYVKYGFTEATFANFTANCTTLDLNKHKTELRKRYEYTCFLKNLVPDQEYYFQAVYWTNAPANATNLVNSTTEDGKVPYQVESSIRKFRTMHNLADDIVWVTAGEVGISDRAATLISQAASYDPYFIAFTGNMAFDSGLPSCTYRWVDFFKQYDKYARTSDGYMIPILTSVGKYEAKFNLFGSGRSDINPYLNMFAHSVTVAPYNQPTYHIHKLGQHSSLVVLDSGISSTHVSQVEYLNSKWASSDFVSTRKFAMYNAPLYPSVSSYNFAPSVSGRTYWAPIFDNFGLIAAFEGLDRTLKRTKPISNEQVVGSGGVVYIGDGSCGVQKTGTPDTTREYLEYTSDTPHFWVVTATSTSTTLQAINEQGVIVDSTTIQ
jgi:hypothetical protein